MLTPARGVTVGSTGGNIRKLTKVNSLTSNHHFAVCYPPSNIYQNSNNAGSNSALQRTTSESATNRKPKTTSSFEITSVTVGHPKLNAAGDTGDESADDLDESHTDDNSRITDLENETPSMSEDTFSKEEVYYANNALSTNAPVIPTSSQYGLVVVDPIGPSLGQTIQNVQVNVSDNIINVVSGAVTPGGTKKKDDIKETQHRSERFKVVKIESTEPFKRGRWMCMDYLDHSSVGNGGNNNEKTGSSTSDAHAATADGAAGVAGGNLDYARTAAMQLQQTLQQLKQREEAMDVPPGGYPNYQNGGEVAGGAANNNNSGGAAAGESQLSTSYVEQQQQQPLSPAPLTPQATPTFAAADD
ncbi:hypothetical protein M5D96_004936 [Drosophila gunungcola]|uniref:Uncharacterized protein n=1 Tax=Drosophila gunungcola TaxID=103775 RepID=A0A9P9YVE8_9MUSC|nr:hypothetical protein M5D96_004936 [Drosophila gunungcola]